MQPTLNFSQQDDVFDPNAAQPVTVIGAGSVGSQLVSMLAKIGCREIAVWDGDDVESHNIPMSAFRLSDLGKPKVEALRALVEEQSGVRIEAIPRMYAGENLTGTVVACVDSMEARKLLWDRVRDNPNVDVFVDTRIAEEFVAVYAVAPCDRESAEAYGKLLYPSSLAVRPTCGRHGIVYVTAVAASAAVACLTNAWSGRKKDRHFKMLVGSLERLS
ncbi:MAG TPA: ThiF family adenylyltransferase [Candidatus Binatia bacterium]|nr:ThiF family adenylyltransferase [Candidatus Binatia bacterium]